jgi:hypothetical protein
MEKYHSKNILAIIDFGDIKEAKEWQEKLKRG